ncbi:MAG: flagellar protein FlgN [Firmicutes bacterium]|nr:flagellar protein FlgN [Bacillota bacterium]
MESLFFELTQILARQGEILKEQLKASQEQNEALLRLDNEKLDAAVKRLEELSGQMTELDQKREAVQRQLEQALNMKPGATIMQLLPKAPFELIFKLKDLSKTMKADLQQLSGLNEINNILTRRVLQVNEALLEIFKSGGDKKTYQHSGEVKHSHRSTAVLDKTV